MKQLLVLILIVGLFCQFPLTANGQKENKQVKIAGGKYADKLRKFEEFVTSQIQRDRIPGMTIGFIKDDYKWIKGFGYADLENKIPAKPDSAYQTASIFKGLTSVAILKLAEQGKINLDAEVQTYVPYFPKKKFPVTIRQLLAHLGGISHYKNEWEKYNKEPKTTRETIAIFADYDLVAEPGTKFSYSTYGYDLLGAVIEEVTKQPYGDYMRENVWKPLGMNATRMDNHIEFIPNRVRGYQYFDNGEKNAIFGEVRNAEFIDFSTRFAAGGGRTTVEDMLNFGDGMNKGKLLSKESRDLTHTSPVTKDGRISGFSGTAGYNMGALLVDFNGRFCVFYNGGQNGTSTSIYTFPSENLTIAFATNIQSNRGLPYLARLFQLIMDEPMGVSAYTGNQTSDDQFSAMQNVFNWGMSYFDIRRKPVTENPKELAEAFTYFNKYAGREFLTSSREEAIKKINEGRQPFAGQPFTKLGSFMAQRLAEKYGVEKLKSYHSAGAIPFLNDYIETYKNDPGFPKEFRFNEPFEVMISGWNQSWQKTNTEYVRSISITPETDFQAVGQQLKRTFAGAETYPDLGLNAYFTNAYGSNFFNTVRQLVFTGDIQKAVKVGELAVELYPQSDFSITALALAKMTAGDREAAQMLFRKASEMRVDGAAGAGNLNSMAYNFATAGKPDVGLELLKAAVELYPKEANLYNSLGEFYSRKGQRDEAVKSYKKEMELNPNSASAKKALEKLGTQ
jgi:CubicO group peptidase (beta-lactamase class C family)/tetratricopeptide (TPR) repeat protein